MPSSTFLRRRASAGGRSCRWDRRATAIRPISRTRRSPATASLIDLDDLVERGWLAHEASTARARLARRHVDFDAVTRLEGTHRCGWPSRGSRARAATRNSRSSSPPTGAWLDDYVLYQALKDVHGGLALVRMGAGPGRCGTRRHCARWRERLAEGIQLSRVRAVCLRAPVAALRAACRERGVMLIGDLPIFVAHDSADVWANPELFYLDERGRPLGGRRRAAGLLQRDGPVLGQPALPVGCPRRGRLRVVGRPALASCSAGSTSSGSTISAASRRTGRSRPGSPTAASGEWVARAGKQASSRRCGGGSAHSP